MTTTTEMKDGSRPLVLADFAKVIRTWDLAPDAMFFYGLGDTRHAIVLRCTDEQIEDIGIDPDIDSIFGKSIMGGVPVYLFMVRFGGEGGPVFDMPLDMSDERCLESTKVFMRSSLREYLLIGDTKQTAIRTPDVPTDPLLSELERYGRDMPIHWTPEEFQTSVEKNYYAIFEAPADAWAYIHSN